VILCARSISGQLRYWNLQVRAFEKASSAIKDLVQERRHQLLLPRHDDVSSVLQ
jgi:hypothetical protein